MSKANNKDLPGLENPCLEIARLVVKGGWGLHDDRFLLMPKEELIEFLTARSSRDIQQLIDNQLIVPVEKDQSGIPLFNALICLEYIPGEYCWRPVEASGYMFIHCIFSGFKNIYKGKGYGSLLLDE